jgi:hypothetical protein
MIFLQFFLEFLMIILFPVAELFEFLRVRKVVPPGKVDGKVIVIVERWFNRNFYHKRWKQYLEKQGFTVYYIHLPLLKGHFRDSAEELKKTIERYHLQHITLVGLSNGGISSLLYLQDFNGWTKVDCFITIGAPFRGTYMSLPLLFIPSVRELWPDSSLMRHLAAEKIMHPERILCLRAKVDELVPVWSSTLPKIKYKVIPVYGHNMLHVRSKKSYDMIIKYTKNVAK